MTRAECLHTAEEIVTKDRNSQYGEPEDCFALIAKLWTAYTAVKLSSADVAAMMIMLKVARVRNGKAKEDSWVDMAGYAACGAECAAAMSGCERVGGVDYGTVPSLKAEEVPSTGSPFGHGDIPVKTM